MPVADHHVMIRAEPASESGPSRRHDDDHRVTRDNYDDHHVISDASDRAPKILQHRVVAKPRRRDLAPKDPQDTDF